MTRPPVIVDGDVRSIRVELKASPSEVQRWRDAAAADQRSLADWIRLTLDRVTRKVRGRR